MLEEVPRAGAGRQSPPRSSNARGKLCVIGQRPRANARAQAFYQHVLATLQQAHIPVLVGGAYAFECYTGIRRRTKDFDLFVHPRDRDQALAALAAAGCDTEVKFPHWLAKARRGAWFVDLIYSSGNGCVPVDDEWFEHATDAIVLGLPARLSPPEEMFWSKAFIMERERYDGADIAHLIHTLGDVLDWPRLLGRFGLHWRVLLSCLVLYGFVYPFDRERVPAWLMSDLLARLQQEQTDAAPRGTVCQGTLLSREQYLVDVGPWGYRDARLAPRGAMQPAELAIWTAAIEEEHERGGDDGS